MNYGYWKITLKNLIYLAMEELLMSYKPEALNNN